MFGDADGLFEVPQRDDCTLEVRGAKLRRPLFGTPAGTIVDVAYDLQGGIIHFRHDQSFQYTVPGGLKLGRLI